MGGDWNHIRNSIIQAFPPLKDAGGIELLRTSGPYSKSLTVIESKFAHSVAKLKEYVEQAKVYVRPLQANIPLSDVDEDTEQKVRISNIPLTILCMIKSSHYNNFSLVSLWVTKIKTHYPLLTEYSCMSYLSLFSCKG